MSSESEAKSAVVLELAEEFLERYRRGERPSLKEYIDRRPDLADEIREVLPAMAMMENVAIGDQSLAGDSSARGERQPPMALEQLGDYRIIREVGRGGMGVVYEAEQVSLGRHVALKVLPQPQLVDAKHRRRFQREAKAAAKLHHTNIVPVFGVGEQEGLCYYVMQFIQGLGLDDVLIELRKLKNAGPGSHLPISRGPAVGSPGESELSAATAARSLLTGEFYGTLDEGAAPAVFSPAEKRPHEDEPPGPGDPSSADSSTVTLPGQSASATRRRAKTYWHSVAQVGVQVAEALDYAHQQGIIHRDIKPSNLLLDTRGTVWVTDFGLAKADDQQNLTHTGDILGTLRYLPPEAFEGRTNARGDIYALGLTLYELLALRPAFDEKDRHRLIARVTSEEPPRLDRLNRAIPRDLVTIVHKAIDREPRQRYASAGELAADLQRFLDDEPIKARRTGQAERAWRWCKRNPALAGALAAAVLILLVGFAGVTWKWQDERAARADADAARQKAETLAGEIRQNLDRLNEANARIESGRAWVQTKKYALAHEQFTQAIQVHSDHSYAWTERGTLYCRLQLWDRARSDLERALQLRPDQDYRLQFQQAFFRLQAGDAAGYRQVCGDMLQTFDPDGRAGNPYFAVRAAILAPDAVADPGRLVLAAEYNLQSSGRHAVHLFTLGAAYYRARRHDDALRVLEEARSHSLRWDPGLIEIMLAMTCHRLERPSEARKWLAQADTWVDEQLVWNPDSRRFIVPLGGWWEDRASLEMLLGEAKQLIEKAPADDFRWRLLRARAFVELAEVEPAAAEYAKAAALRPGDSLVRGECFSFFVAQGYREKADAELAELVKLRPGDPGVFLRAFRAYAGKQDWPRAKAYHYEAVRLKPEDHFIALEHFRYHADRDEWPQAEAAYAEQLARRPHLRMECGRYYHDRQLWDRAADEYAKVVELAPDNVFGAWYPYAVLCLRAGRQKEYRAVCEQLLERFERTDQARRAWEVAVICKLAPQAVADVGRVVTVARTGKASSPGVLGHCLYRAGQYQDAVDLLTESIPKVQDISHIWDKYFLAMAYQKLGKEPEARRWLAEANQALTDENFPVLVARWDMRLDLQMLRAEAEGVLLGPQLRKQAAGLIQKKQWAEALGPLNRLIASGQALPEDWSSRGRCYAEQGQWPAAAADFAKALEAQPDNAQHWYDQAAVHLATDKPDEYRRVCATMLERFADSKEPGAASRVVYICVPLPDTAKDPGRLERLAEVAVPLFVGNQRVLGAAHYRAGRYEAALEQFEKSAAVRPRKAWDWLFLAMAHHRLGRPDEARTCLARAAQWIEEAGQKPAAADPWLTWVAWSELVEVSYLRREAETLINP